MRPLLLPGLLDAAARNAAHGRPDVRLFESAHVYRSGRARRRTGGATNGSGPRAALTPAIERHHIGALITQAAPATWRSPERARRLLRRQGAASRRCSRPTGVDVVGRAGRAAVPAPRPCGVDPRGRRAKLGWIGELHPLVARAWDLRRRRRRVRDRRRPAGRARPGPGAGRGPDDVPGAAPGHRGGRRRGRPGGRGRARRARGRRRPAARRRACSTSTAASRSARATSRSRCGSSSGPTTARSPTRTSAARRAAIEKALDDEIGGRLRG